MPRHPSARDHVKECVHQADEIKTKSHIIKNSCEYCFLKGFPCIMDLKNHNCALCT